MGYDDRRQMVFGTQRYLQMIEAPLRAADESPDGWSVDGTLLNGGGYALNSFGSHKTYTYEWRGTSAPEVAQTMKSYADGTFGREMIYFINPVTYKRNVLPAQWADPSMTLNYEGTSLVYGVEGEATPTSNFALNRLPVTSVHYNLNSTPFGYRGPADSVFVPGVESSVTYIGAMYQSTGSGGIYMSLVNANDDVLLTIRLPEIGNSEQAILTSGYVTGQGGSVGIRLWIGREDASPGTVTVSALSARVYPITVSDPAVLNGPWVGGMGHSGVRFLGKPTFVTNSAVIGDGQVGFAASFIETGSWAYG